MEFPYWNASTMIQASHFPYDTRHNVHIYYYAHKLLHVEVVTTNHKYNVIQSIYEINRNKNDFIFIVKRTRYVQSEKRGENRGKCWIIWGPKISFYPPQ